MGESTAISWTNSTWNPWHGCRKVSPGCKNCYMFREKRQYGQEPTLVVRSKTKFSEPLKWKEPALVFTCSWSDWFIEEADAWRDDAWAIIRATPHLTYQILTKRIERAENHLPHDWPLKNVWLGVSVEDQAHADRVRHLLNIDATVHFVSYEPALGALNLAKITVPKPQREPWEPVPLAGDFEEINALRGELIRGRFGFNTRNRLEWVIVGGESGPGARPSHPDWFRSLRGQCIAAGVPFHFKQWGEWAPLPVGEIAALERLPQSAHVCLVKPDGRAIRPYSGLDAPGAQMVRIGKKNAGRTLDGREWNEFPAEVTA